VFVPLILAGCAAATPGTRPADTITIVTGSGATYQVYRGEDVRANPSVTVKPDSAWNVLPKVYADLGFEPDVRDASRRTLGVSAHRFSTRFLGRNASDFFDCGLDPGLNRPTADMMPISARVVSTVMPSAAGAEIATVVEGSARRTGGNAGIAVCRSTGLLEVTIGQMVQRLAAPADTTRYPKGPQPD
jgi:hypothetical protein